MLDIGGLLLFLAGAAVYGWAWIGMRHIDQFEPASGAGPFATVARMDDLATLSRVGIGVMAAGAVVALVAVVVHRRGHRAVGGPVTPPE